MPHLKITHIHRPTTQQHAPYYHTDPRLGYSQHNSNARITRGEKSTAVSSSRNLIIGIDQPDSGTTSSSSVNLSPASVGTKIFSLIKGSLRQKGNPTQINDSSSERVTNKQPTIVFRHNAINRAVRSIDNRVPNVGRSRLDSQKPTTILSFHHRPREPVRISSSDDDSTKTVSPKPQGEEIGGDKVPMISESNTPKSLTVSSLSQPVDRPSVIISPKTSDERYRKRQNRVARFRIHPSTLGAPKALVAATLSSPKSSAIIARSAGDGTFTNTIKKTVPTVTHSFSSSIHLDVTPVSSINFDRRDLSPKTEVRTVSRFSVGETVRSGLKRSSSTKNISAKKCSLSEYNLITPAETLSTHVLEATPHLKQLFTNAQSVCDVSSSEDTSTPVLPFTQPQKKLVNIDISSIFLDKSSGCQGIEISSDDEYMDVIRTMKAVEQRCEMKHRARMKKPEAIQPREVQEIKAREVSDVFTSDTLDDGQTDKARKPHTPKLGLTNELKVEFEKQPLPLRSMVDFSLANIQIHEHVFNKVYIGKPKMQRMTSVVQQLPLSFIVAEVPFSRASSMISTNVQVQHQKNTTATLESELATSHQPTMGPHMVPEALDMSTMQPLDTSLSDVSTNKTPPVPSFAFWPPCVIPRNSRRANSVPGDGGRARGGSIPKLQTSSSRTLASPNNNKAAAVEFFSATSAGQVQQQISALLSPTVLSEDAEQRPLIYVDSEGIENDDDAESSLTNLSEEYSSCQHNKHPSANQRQVHDVALSPIIKTITPSASTVLQRINHLRAIVQSEGEKMKQSGDSTILQVQASFACRATQTDPEPKNASTQFGDGDVEKDVVEERACCDGVAIQTMTTVPPSKTMATILGRPALLCDRCRIELDQLGDKACQTEGISFFRSPIEPLIPVAFKSIRKRRGHAKDLWGNVTDSDESQCLEDENEIDLFRQFSPPPYGDSCSHGSPCPWRAVTKRLQKDLERANCMRKTHRSPHSTGRMRSDSDVRHSTHRPVHIETEVQRSKSFEHRHNSFMQSRPSQLPPPAFPVQNQPQQPAPQWEDMINHLYIRPVRKESSVVQSRNQSHHHPPRVKHHSEETTHSMAASSVAAPRTRPIRDNLLRHTFASLQKVRGKVPSAVASNSPVAVARVTSAHRTPWKFF